MNPKTAGNARQVLRPLRRLRMSLHLIELGS